MPEFINERDADFMNFQMNYDLADRVLLLGPDNISPLFKHDPNVVHFSYKCFPPIFDPPEDGSIELINSTGIQRYLNDSNLGIIAHIQTGVPPLTIAEDVWSPIWNFANDRKLLEQRFERRRERGERWFNPAIVMKLPPGTTFPSM